MLLNLTLLPLQLLLLLKHLLQRQPCKRRRAINPQLFNQKLDQFVPLVGA